MNAPQPGTYQLDPGRCAVTFRTRHLFGLAPVRGTFRVRAGEIRIGTPVRESAVYATVDAESFHTGNPHRDTTVRSARLLDTGRCPDLVFRGGQPSAMEGREADSRQAGEQWTVAGTLTVAGRQQPAELTVTEVSADGAELSLRASAVIDRYAFGITAYRGLAGRRLTCQIDVVAARRNDADDRG